MGELIAYISELFGLKVTSRIALADMESDIGEIQNHAEYFRYLKNGFNLGDIQYQTAYQKFLTLTKRYKEIESASANLEKIERMGTVAERLSDKVKTIDIIVLNGVGINFGWEGFKIDKNQYFSDKEIKALKSIGSPLMAIRLQRQVSGRDLLRERLEELFIERVTHPQLEAPKNSMGIIANLAKAVKA